MVKQHKQADFILLLSLVLCHLRQRVNRNETAAKIVKSRGGDELFVESHQLSRHLVDQVQLEVHDLVSSDSQVIADSLRQGVEVLLLHAIPVLLQGSHVSSEERVHQVCRHYRLQVVLLIRCKARSLISRGQMNCQVRNLQDRILGTPILRHKFATFLDDNLASKSQVSVEPSVPESASVRLHCELLVSSLVIHLRCSAELTPGHDHDVI